MSQCFLLLPNIVTRSSFETDMKLMRMLLLTWIYLFIFVNEIGLTFMRLESEKWSISLIGLEEGVSNMCLILKPIITIWLGPLGLNNSQASVLLSPPPMPMPMPCGQDVYASKLFFCRSNSTVVVVVNELITIPSARKHMNFDGFVDFLITKYGTG